MDLFPQIIENIYDQWVPVPNTGLQIWLFRSIESTELRFSRGGALISIHIFCMGGLYADELFDIVLQTLRQYGYNDQQKPTDLNWIFSMPTSSAAFDQAENTLICSIANFIYVILLIQQLREAIEN